MFQRIRILIAENHDALRGAIRNLLESRSEFEVCGEARDGAQAVEKTAELKPDVVLLSASMPIINGFEAARQIRAASPRSRIVILSSYSDQRLQEEVKNIGAFCYVAKADAEQELIEAVKPRQGVLSSAML